MSRARHERTVLVSAFFIDDVRQIELTLDVGCSMLNISAFKTQS